VQESDWGKSCRTRFGGMFVCTGRLDAKPPGGNRCRSKRTASFATSSSGNSAASSVNRRQARHGLLLVSDWLIPGSQPGMGRALPLGTSGTATAPESEVGARPELSV